MVEEEEAEPVEEEVAAAAAEPVPVEEEQVEETEDTSSSAADEDVVNPPPKPFIPPTMVVKNDDGSIPPRKNMPVDVVEYEDEGDLFVAVEPTVRKMTVGKTGDMGINFSSGMVYPEEWIEKAASDAETLQKEAEGQSRRLRKLRMAKGLKLNMHQAGKNYPKEIDPNAIIFTSINNTRKLEVKVEFDNPGLVSLSD